MSLRVIDTQMMITNSAEVSRDSVSQVQRLANAQEFSALQAKAVEEHERRSVGDVEDVFKVELKSDDENAKQPLTKDSHSEDNGTSPDADKVESQGDLFAGYNQNTLDITI